MDHHHNQSSYTSYYGNSNGNSGSGGGYYSRDGSNSYHHNYYQNGHSNNTNHTNYSMQQQNPPSSSLARSSSYYNDSDYSKPSPSLWDRADFYHEPSRYSKSLSNDLYYSDSYYSKRLDPLYPSSSSYPDNNRKYDYNYPPIPSSSYRTASNDRYYETALVPPSSSAGYQNPYPNTFHRPSGFFNDSRLPSISSYDSRIESIRFPNSEISSYADRRWAPSKLDSSRADRWSKFDTYSHASSSFSSTNPLISANKNQSNSLADSPSKKPFSWKPRESRFAPLSPFKAKSALNPNKAVTTETNESKETPSKKKAAPINEIPATADGKENTIKAENTLIETDAKGEDEVVKEEKVIEKIQGKFRNDRFSESVKSSSTDPAVEILVKNCLNLIDYKMSLALLPLGLSFATLKEHLSVAEPKIESAPLKTEPAKESKEDKIPAVSPLNAPTIPPKPSETQPQSVNESKGEDKPPTAQKRPLENVQSEQQKKKLKSNDSHIETTTPNKQQIPSATPKSVPSRNINSSNGKVEDATNNLAKQFPNHVHQPLAVNSAQKTPKDPTLSSHQPVTPHTLKANPNPAPPSIQKPSQATLSRASSINTPSSNTPAPISKKPQTPYNSTPHNPPPVEGSNGSNKKDPPSILSNGSSSTKPKTPHAASNSGYSQTHTPNLNAPSSSGTTGYHDGFDRRTEDWNERARDDWSRGNGDYRNDRRYDTSGPVGPPFSATKYAESDLRRNVSGEWRDDRYRYDYNQFPPSTSSSNLSHGGYSGKFDPNYSKYEESYNRGRDPPYYPTDYPLPPTMDPYPAPRGSWDSMNRGWNEPDRGKLPYEYGNIRGSTYPPGAGPPPSVPRREGQDYYDSKYYDRKNYY